MAGGTWRRVWVVGTSGSGKSTLAARIAARLGMPHVELDAFFHEPGWKEAADEVFRARVESAVAEPGWVIDGNYHGRVGDLVASADLVVWLDYPARVRWPRVVARSVHRAATRRELWNGNRESVRDWFRATHPIWWTLTHHRNVRSRYEAIADTRWVRLARPRDTRQWLETLGGSSQSLGDDPQGDATP